MYQNFKVVALVLEHAARPVVGWILLQRPDFSWPGQDPRSFVGWQILGQFSSLQECCDRQNALFHSRREHGCDSGDSNELDPGINRYPMPLNYSSACVRTDDPRLGKPGTTHRTRGE